MYPPYAVVFGHSAYVFSICYQKGRNYANADFFSRQTVNAYLDQKAELEVGSVSFLVVLYV